MAISDFSKEKLGIPQNKKTEILIPIIFVKNSKFQITRKYVKVHSFSGVSIKLSFTKFTKCMLY